MNPLRNDHEISGKANFSAWKPQWIAKKRRLFLKQIFVETKRDYKKAVKLIGSLKAQDYQKCGATTWKKAARKRPEELTKEDTDTAGTFVTFHWRHMNLHINEIENGKNSKYFSISDTQSMRKWVKGEDLKEWMRGGLRKDQEPAQQHLQGCGYSAERPCTCPRPIRVE